ncbi:MAG: glycosyltransferase family 87 protein [Candidatus Dormibacteria bacterium]
MARRSPSPFVNPPIAAWVMLPFSLLPLRAAYLLWDITGLIAFAAGLVWLGRTSPKLDRMDLLVLALASSYPVYLTLGQGQFDLLWPLAAALFASSMGCSERLRYIPRAAVAALIVAIKPDLFIAFLVPLVAGWRRAPVRVAVATLLILGAATALILGPAGLGDVVHIELYTIAKRFPPSLDMTVVGLFYRVLGPGWATSALGIAAIPLGVGGFWWAWRRNPPRTSADWWLALTAACCLSLLISPHDLVQGLLLLAAPALLVAKALRASGRSLLPLAGWILAFDLVTLVDMSPHLYLPIRLTPVLLLIAAVSAWRLRSRLVGGATSIPALRNGGDPGTA